jgi:hypothetical protein
MRFLALFVPKASGLAWVKNRHYRCSPMASLLVIAGLSALSWAALIAIVVAVRAVL